MEARSRVAAAAAAVVPFHCVICFDEFNLTDRPPMVLPCGHTYVCLPCSKRLKRCMECREPLFIPVRNQQQQQQQQQNPRSSSSYSSRRYGPSASPQTPATPPHSSFPQSSPPAHVPLPIPKNVVLLALMEASQRQVEAQQKDQEEGKENSLKSSNSHDEDGEEEEEEDQFDLNRIISGMATLSGPCGTYAVKESSLVIVPNDPRTSSASDGEEKKLEPVEESCIAAEPHALEQGQTVQVVEFEDGIAKLARGEGYILANSSQLVKGRTDCLVLFQCFDLRCVQSCVKCFLTHTCIVFSFFPLFSGRTFGRKLSSGRFTNDGRSKRCGLTKRIG